MSVKGFMINNEGLNETPEGEKKDFSAEFQIETFNDLKEKPLAVMPGQSFQKVETENQVRMIFILI
jgi:hypothetical protein